MVPALRRASDRTSLDMCPLVSPFRLPCELVALAAGLGLAIFTSRLCDPEDFCNGLAILSFSAIVGGPVVGALIDHSITTPIYRAPRGGFTAHLGVSPRLQRHGGAISLNMAF